MKKWITLILAMALVIPAMADEKKLDKENCTITINNKTFPLHGKVKIVESFADLKVKIVNSFANLEVKLVEAFPDDCGEIKLVEAFPDVTIQIVEAFPDITVKIVDAFPGIEEERLP